MREIPLTRGLVAIVDDQDFEMVSRRRWHAHRVKQVRENYYAATTGNRAAGEPQTVYMHRLILGAGPGEQVDHEDGNGLHNTRSNLRKCTQSLNNANRESASNKHGYRGIDWFPDKRKFRARVRFDGRVKRLGYFDTAEEAARRYDAEARRIFGPFASLNFPAEHEAERAA